MLGTREMVVSLVVGGAGFIGSHLVEELVKLGREVTVIDDFSNGRMENLSSVDSKIRVVKHDVSHDYSSLDDVDEPDEIYSLACYPRQISFANPGRDCEVNVIGTINALRLALKTKAKVLFTSNTGIVSGPPRLPVDETFPPSPSSPYDVHKLASEYLLRLYSQRYDLRTVTVRFATIYGPRQRVNEALGWRPVIPEFATKLLKGEVPTIDGDGSQTRDFLYVKDAVDGVIRAMESKELEGNHGGMFIFGTNTETSIQTLYLALCTLLGQQTKPRYGPRKPEEISRMRYDYSRAKSTFGFEPRTKLSDGLKTTVEFLGNELRR
jgi:UDP-glucose 4-epimerase